MDNLSGPNKQIDELKASTLRSYIDKGRRDADLGGLNAAAGRTPQTPYAKKLQNRYKGAIKATMKLSRGDYQKEDTEQIDELKKDTMMSFAKKSARQAKNILWNEHPKTSDPAEKEKLAKLAVKKSKAAHMAGTKISKLAKEDIDSVDEYFNPANPKEYGVNAFKPSNFATKGTANAQAKQMVSLKKKIEKKPSMLNSLFGAKPKTKVSEETTEKLSDAIKSLRNL